MPTNFDVRITYKGDWKEFEKFLSYSWGLELKQSISKATALNARYILKMIRQKIRDKEYQINTRYTAIKKGFATPESATPLVDTGRLIREALNTVQRDVMQWEVGIIGDTQMSHSTSKMSDIIPILHDGGTFTVKKGTRSVTIRIPARPFLSSVWEDPNVLKEINKNWEEAIKRILKKYGKL